MRAYCHGNQSRLQPTTLLSTTPLPPLSLTLSLSLAHSIALDRAILSFPIYPRYPSHPTSFAKKLWKPFNEPPLFLDVGPLIFFPSTNRGKEDRERSGKRSHLLPVDAGRVIFFSFFLWEKRNLICVLDRA